MSKIIYKQLSYKVVGCAFKVHRALGAGLVESAYEKAICEELKRISLPFERQKAYKVHYDGKVIGRFITDIVVDNTIILELKSVAKIIPFHEAQLLNYLKLSHLPVGYLFNFNAVRLAWHRFANTKGSP
ncbi:MAG: GxxExxY protein [Spirochaetales bacterium]|nr:GxxExxY protein [Spirochaetales bacterium]